MSQYVFLLVFSLIGAILTFVGLTSLLPIGIYRKIFGSLWPLGPSESRGKALQRRLMGAVITAIGFITLRAGIVALSRDLLAK